MIFNGNENVRATVLDAFYNSVILHGGCFCALAWNSGAKQVWVVLTMVGCLLQRRVPLPVIPCQLTFPYVSRDA